MTDTTIVSTVTFIAGLSPTILAWWKQRKRQPSENLRNEVAAAKDVNDMALRTLDKVHEEMEVLARRLEIVEATQERTVKELDRISGLFREAVEVLRSVIEGAKKGQLPDLELSEALLHEVRKVGFRS